MRAPGGPLLEPLTISRSAQGTLLRFLAAGGVVLAWLGIALMDVVLSLMLWSEPNPEVLIYTSPMLVVIPWILQMACARGKVVVQLDHIEIRHRRVLRHPIFLRRDQVSRILIDDGSTTGRARFPTGNLEEPLLWTDPVPRKQYADRPLIGDGILPNVAIVLAQPLPMTMARSSLTSLTMACELPPPRRSGHARALLLAMEDLNEVRVALAEWPTEEAAARGQVIPAQVAAAAAQVGQDAAVMVTLAMATAMLLVIDPALAIVPFSVSLIFVWRMTRRRQREAEEARAQVSGRVGWGSAEEATALAAIDANFGGHRSEGPPV